MYSALSVNVTAEWNSVLSVITVSGVVSLIVQESEGQEEPERDEEGEHLC